MVPVLRAVANALARRSRGEYTRVSSVRKDYSNTRFALHRLAAKSSLERMDITRVSGVIVNVGRHSGSPPLRRQTFKFRLE